MNYDLSGWPQLDVAQVRASFAEVPLAAYTLAERTPSCVLTRRQTSSF